MKRYFLGVDGGGTKTQAVVIGEDGEFSEGSAGALDILNESEENFRLHLFKAVNEALKKLSLKPSNISQACFGIPAVGDVSGIEDLVMPIIKKFDFPFFVVNDVRVALEGAFPFTDGVIVLAGTGAMIMGKKEGKIFRVDGWGEHAGDMGSAYFVGKLLLQRIFKEYDGRARRDDLLDIAKEFAQVADIREILLGCKGSNVRKYIASFSKLACHAAESGVKVAKDILDMAVKELLQSVEVVLKSMDIGEVPLACVGGMFRCSYFLNKFEDEVKKIGRVRIVEKEFEPHVGAAILAASRVLSGEEVKRFHDLLKNGGKR